MDLPDPPVDFQAFYVDNASFWDDFGLLVNKVLCRRYLWLSCLDEVSKTDEI